MEHPNGGLSTRLEERLEATVKPRRARSREGPLESECLATGPRRGLPPGFTLTREGAGAGLVPAPITARRR